MRNYVWVLLAALAVLPSCTGSSDDQIRALLAVAVNPPTPSGVAPLIRFYDTSTLIPGSGTSPKKVWEWPQPANDPVVSLLYQRSTAGGGPDQLWVLSKNQLRRFSTAGFATNLSTAPPVPANTVDSPDLGLDCSQGYLRLGSSTLLVVCPPPDPASTALPKAWKVSLASPTLDPAANPPLDLSALVAQTPLRLALDNQDRLVYLGGLGGVTIGIGQTRVTGSDLFRDLTSLAGKPAATAFPNDLIVQTNASTNTSTAYGLFSDPTVTTAVTYLLSWDLSGTPAFVPAPDASAGLSARFFATGGPPLVLLGGPTNGNPTPGAALARFDGAYKLPPSNVLDRGLQYSAATLGLDQYLYAAQANSPYLWVLDFFGPTEGLTVNGRAQVILDTAANLPSVALTYIPVAQ